MRNENAIERSFGQCNSLSWSVPRFLFFGLSDSLRLAGLRLDEVLTLFDGLEAPPEVLLSVLSVLDELWELRVDAVQVPAGTWSSPSLESSLESLNGIVRICEAR